MKPCVSAATTMGASFAEDVAAHAEAGAAGLEVWLTKLETHLERHSPAETRKLLQDRNLTLAAAAYQGGLLLSQGEERRAHYDHFQRRLGLCQELGIDTLLVVPGFADTVSGADLERARVSLAQAAQLGASYGVRLALEFRGGSRWCASLPTAAALVEACGEPNAGLCFDVFHYYTGPSKLQDLELLTAQNLFHVQLCDLSGVPRELATDADRILPGDGDFDLISIIGHVRRIGYQGWASVEVLNPDLWRMKPAQVAQAAFTALRRVLE